MTVHIPKRPRRGRPWPGRSLPFITGALTLALSVTLVNDPRPAAAATTVPSAPEKAAVTQAADILSARVAARLSGKPVEALSERSETSMTWANKDGSLTTELTAGPARYEDETTGEWTDVDLDLVTRPDGSVEPAAHPRGLKIAGGSGRPASSLKVAQASKATDLVTLGEGDEQITLQWKGGLPEPKLDGTRAEYVNAVPGADVVVEATRTGFEQYVEIKQRPATDSYTYTLPLKTRGLKAEQQADGSVLFTDRKNKKQAVMPAPVMWDSTVDEQSGEHTRRVPVAMKVVAKGSAVDLVMTPDAEFLADPETKYPVTVDPSTSSLANVFDTYVQQGETRDWSTDVELDLGNPGTKNADGTPRTAQSFISWNTAPIQDALILNAKLSLWNFHSGNNVDCKAYPWEVWSSPAATTSSRWTNRPTMTAKKATSTETRGNTSCTAQPDGWINADVTTLAQEWASAKAVRGHMGLRAASESVVAQWKRVNSANAASNPPKLVVNYNYRPSTGTKQETGPPYLSYGGAYTVNTLTPTLRDTFVDSDGDKVNGTFQIFDDATNTQVGDVIVSKYVPSGQAASVTVPAGVLAHGKTYRFRTSPYDGSHYNAGWSAWKTFTVDTSAPSAPAKIVSTDYPSGTWVKGAGQAGTFTVTPPSSDHQWLEWSLDGSTWTKVVTGGAAGVKNITVKPSEDGTHTLQVRTVDKADNKSEPAEYVFHVGPGGFVEPSDGDRTARRLPLIAEAEAGKYNQVSFSWRRAEADAWVRIPAAHVTAGGVALTAWPVPLTNGRNAPLVWNATETVDPDGSVQIRAEFAGPNAATGSTEPLPLTVDRDASGAADEQVGPGTLNLLTGDYSLSSSDVSVFDLQVTRSASSRTPAQGAGQEGQAPIFGKEWVAGALADAETPYAHIRRISDTAVAVIGTDGEETHFTANAAKNGWIPEPGSESLTLSGKVTGSFTLSDTDGAVTTFTKPTGVATWQVDTTQQDGLTHSTSTVVSQVVTVAGKQLARPYRIIGATSAANGSTCSATPSTKGCRSLEYVYATSTTATSTALGDFSGQVKEIRIWATDPGASAATAQTVQTYAYDSAGRLREAWDPRVTPALKTAYGYDGAGRVTSLTPPGELPWTFVHGKAGQAETAGEGMLLKVERAGLKQGTAATVEGTAAASIVYDVALTGSSAPYPMGAAQTKTWGQHQPPTDATAIFPADAVPAAHSGSSLSAALYRRAAIRYLNASGQESNSAAPGGHLTTTEYDRFGNIVRELTPANRGIALGLTAADRDDQADLGINALSSSERAELLSSRTVFSDNGLRDLEAWEPLRRIDLTEALKDGTTDLVAAGTSVPARGWVVKEYDAGRPTDGSATVRDRVTMEISGARVRGYDSVMGEKRVQETQYDWVKGQRKLSIQDSGGLNITSSWDYDAEGRPTSAVLPGGTGNDAASKITAYWSADGTGWCKGRPEWADLVCWSGPAGAITGGGSQPSELVDTTSEYDRWGNPAKAVETANGVTRTTTVTYDTAGRQIKESVTGGLGQEVPDMGTEYDPATGRVARTTSAAGGTISRAYDKLGRLISYTDADGGTTRTEYDLVGRTVKESDSAPSTVTFTYDTAAEPRGLATSVTDSVAGTFGAVYGPDGSVVQEKLPGGYTLRETVDPSGNPSSRTYTRDSDGTLVYADSVSKSVHHQNMSHSGWSDQTYRYDAAGRLTSVEDTAQTLCTKRTYTFDKRSNRTSVVSAAGNPGEACPTTGGTARTHSYDSADRLVDAGYAYDGLGRTTSVPGHGTFGYYANDLVHQQTANGRRQTFLLDSARRFRSWTVDQDNAGTWTRTQSKVNHYGADGDSPRWITEDSGTGEVTRNVGSASTGLAATTGAAGEVVLHLSNIHGDIALKLPLDTAVAPTASDTDEYGNPRTAGATGRYEWVGSHRRSSETLTGVVLMGMRLYNPQTGRFLSVDPMNGGSCNAYDYACADPQNKEDLDGSRLRERVQQKCRQDVCVRIRRICESNTGRCSLNWDFRFRKSWAKAWIHAGFKWYIHIRGQYVTSNHYGHGEWGGYMFHGAWYSNNKSKGRGWYKCYIWTCRLDAGDSVMFSAWGTATRGGRKYAWSVGQNFGGGGKYS
ncbi:DNRLRE domain-containing protein [Streptomyces microflavus]|uniref:DNRLRE domain-containing protein n=1 Tax=Streptomyces microflavus TaxID=1919 RepID=UPI0036BA4F49